MNHEKVKEKGRRNKTKRKLARKDNGKTLKGKKGKK